MATKKKSGLLKVAAGAPKPKMQVPKPGLQTPIGTGPTTPNPAKAAGLGSAPRGRPVSNIGQYLVKPQPSEREGFEVINDTPLTLQQVHEKYLKAGELPPALQPKYLRKPEVLEHGTLGRAKNISRGWRAPRSFSRGQANST